jgi:hypothetical protein
MKPLQLDQAHSPRGLMCGWMRCSYTRY